MKFKEFIQIVSWDIINPLLLKIKRKRKYQISKNYLGINIGCGINNPKNWIGLDGGFTHYVMHKLPKPLCKLFFKFQGMSSQYSFEEYYNLSTNFKLIHHEVLYGLPFHNDSVPNIFSSHFFEHLFYKDAEFIMKECYRTLRPKGIIRICVPSLSNSVENLVSAINNYKNDNTDEIQKFVTCNIVGYIASYSNHRYMYDLNRLSTLLEKAGFKNIKEFEFRKGNIPNVVDLDTRGGLIVEAIK